MSDDMVFGFVNSQMVPIPVEQIDARAERIAAEVAAAAKDRGEGTVATAYAAMEACEKAGGSAAAVDRAQRAARDLFS